MSLLSSESTRLDWPTRAPRIPAWAVRALKCAQSWSLCRDLDFQGHLAVIPGAPGSCRTEGKGTQPPSPTLRPQPCTLPEPPALPPPAWQPLSLQCPHRAPCPAPSRPSLPGRAGLAAHRSLACVSIRRLLTGTRHTGRWMLALSHKSKDLGARGGPKRPFLSKLLHLCSP